MRSPEARIAKVRLHVRGIKPCMLAHSLRELVDAARVVNSDSHVAPARGFLLSEDAGRDGVLGVAACP
eukprot:11894150-Alexandrium_andersonii.AAC.1